MPGRPKLAALIRRVEEEGIDRILDRIADGEYIKDIAASYSVSRRMIYDLLHSDSDWWEGFRLARQASAAHFAEEGMEILDKAGTATSAEVAKATARAKYRQWLAEKLDRDTFGEQKTPVNVNIGIGELHLSALQSHGRMGAQPGQGELTTEGPTRSLPSPDHIEEAEAEVVS